MSRSFSTVPWRWTPARSSARSVEDHKLPEAECRRACAVAHYVRSVEESKALTADPLPKVIISASGMATGGRVLHHLKRYAPDPKNTILFAGFQAGGTRGAAMMAGAESVKIHGEYVPVRARGGQSRHAVRPCRCGRDHALAARLQSGAANDFHDARRACRIRCAAPSDRGGAWLAMHGPRPRSKGRAGMNERRPMRSARKSEPRSALGFGRSPWVNEP